MRTQNTRRANGKQAPAAQARPSAEAAGCPQAGDKTAAHRQKNAGTPGTKAAARTAGRAKNDQPGKRRGTPGAEKPLRTGKIRVRSFACPEGPCEPGPPKIRFAVFGWHGLFCCAMRRTKGGAAPFIPCKLFEKSLTKNFHAGPGGPAPKTPTARRRAGKASPAARAAIHTAAPPRGR